MKPILVFQTDFTYKESAVAAMYGVVKSVDRELEIMDLSHEIPQFDIWSASFRLYQPMNFWPEGTIFVSVVDPGVGTQRRPCVAKTVNGYYVVTPDNGTLTHVDKHFGIVEIREIDQAVNRLRGKGTEQTNVFHGRDLFSYCAARLASGKITYEEVGSAYPTAEIVRLPIHRARLESNGIEGIFEIGDPNFGNLWTNIPISMMGETGIQYGDTVRLVVHHHQLSVFDEQIPFQPSFGYVEVGEPLLYTNELMNVAAAVSQGNFTERFGLGYGPNWRVTVSRIRSQ